jgi:hypothetical protein
MKKSRFNRRITKIIHVLNDIFWTNNIVRIVTCLSAIASLTGFTLKDLWLDKYQKYIPYILIAIIVAIFVRMFWLLVQDKPEPKAVTRKGPSASKLMEHVKDLVFILNTLPNGSEEKGVVLAELCNKLRDCMDWITSSSCCVSLSEVSENNHPRYAAIIG